MSEQTVSTETHFTVLAPYRNHRLCPDRKNVTLQEVRDFVELTKHLESTKRVSVLRDGSLPVGFKCTTTSHAVPPLVATATGYL